MASRAENEVTFFCVCCNLSFFLLRFGCRSDLSRLQVRFQRADGGQVTNFISSNMTYNMCLKTFETKIRLCSGRILIHI